MMFFWNKQIHAVFWGAEFVGTERIHLCGLILVKSKPCTWNTYIRGAKWMVRQGVPINQPLGSYWHLLGGAGRLLLIFINLTVAIPLYLCPAPLSWSFWFFPRLLDGFLMILSDLKQWNKQWENWIYSFVHGKAVFHDVENTDSLCRDKHIFKKARPKSVVQGWARWHPKSIDSTSTIGFCRANSQF